MRCYLVELSFSTTPVCILNFEKMIFKYKGREFLFLPGGKGYCDNILTIIGSGEAIESAYENIMEFLIAFGWHNNLSTHFECMWYYPAKELNIELERRLDVQRREYRNISEFFGISEINEKQKKALALLNDAKYNSDVFNKFLYYWKIIDLCDENTIKWVDNLISNKKIELNSSLEEIIGSTVSAGNYFNDNCRNAIAHVERFNGRPESVFYFSYNDFEKIKKANHAIEPFVYYFITNCLCLDYGGQMIDVKTIKKLDKSVYNIK